MCLKVARLKTHFVNLAPKFFAHDKPADSVVSLHQGRPVSPWPSEVYDIVSFKSVRQGEKLVDVGDFDLSRGRRNCHVVDVVIVPSRMPIVCYPQVRCGSVVAVDARGSERTSILLRPSEALRALQHQCPQPLQRLEPQRRYYSRPLR